MARELTKKFEEIRTLPAAEWVGYWANHAPRGEFVVIVGPAGEERESVPPDGC